MQVKRFNISKPEKYTDKQTGNEKTFWNNIGTLTEFHKDDNSTSRIIKIPAIGLEANVFEDKPREENGYQAPPKNDTSNDDVLPTIDASRPEDDQIDIKDIPF